MKVAAEEGVSQFGPISVGGLPSAEEPACPETPAVPLTQWEGEKSLELKALHMYSQSGSLAAVARSLSVPLYELQKLSRTDWWKQELAAIQREEAAVQNVKMSRILDKTLVEIEDRLENGDQVLHQGRLVRTKVSSGNLAKLANVIFDKRQLLQGLPTQIDGTNDKLQMLADRLRALGLRDVSDLNNVYELKPGESDGS